MGKTGGFSWWWDRGWGQVRGQVGGGGGKGIQVEENVGVDTGEGDR